MTTGWVPASHPNVPEFSFDSVTRMGTRGFEVYTPPTLEDGKIIVAGQRYLFIGTRPLPAAKQAGREEARRVRRMFAESGVLAWLGEPVLPVRLMTGQEIHQWMREEIKVPRPQ